MTDTNLFWDLADEVMNPPRVEEGTIMGSRCLRVAGEFAAMADHRSGALVVKLPRTRVAALIAEGHGAPFAPAGRVFKEWVLVAEPDEDRWRCLLGEAIAFASGE